MALKILWVTPWFPLHQHDQQGSYIWDAVQALQTEGCEIDVLWTHSWKPKCLGGASIKDLHTEDFPKSLTLRECRYFSIPRHYLRILSNSIYRWVVARKILELARGQHYNLIHVHTEIAALAAALAAKRFKLPFIVTIHGVDTCPRARHGLGGKMIDRALRQADRVILVGEPLLHYFQHRMPNYHDFSIIHNGVRVPKPLNNLPTHIPWQGILHIVSVSNLHEGKGVDITLHALSQLKQNGTDEWTYTIVGDGAERPMLEKLVDALSLRAQVHFVGRCSHDQVYQYLLQADVFCLPSYREAFGIAYLEAMAHGLLTLAVKGQGAQAFIQHGKTGLLMEPENVQDLVLLLKKVFAQRTLMQKIAAQGREFVLKHFTWKHHAEAIVKVYSAVTKK